MRPESKSLFLELSLLVGTYNAYDVVQASSNWNSLLELLDQTKPYTTDTINFIRENKAAWDDIRQTWDDILSFNV